MSKVKGKILVVDDDKDVLTTARIALKQKFSQVITETNPENILNYVKNEEVDVVILDMNFKPGVTDGSEGLFWLKKILEFDPGISVVMNTAYGDIRIAVEAMKLGAVEFIVKPWESEKLIATISNVYNLNKSRKEITKLKNTQNVLSDEIEKDYSEIISRSKEMKPIFSIIDKVSGTDATVLILGENGTGKELIAREIHKKSNRRNSPFINVDLGALSESLFESELFGHTKGAFTDAKEDRLGRFEIASGGTLFLDEIGNLPLNLQSKLLSVIQNRKITKVGSIKSLDIDVRLLCATNKDVYQMAEDEEFRRDLLYRINTVEINLPPLRKRKGDVSLLAQIFLEKFRKKYNKLNLKLSEKAIEQLESYDWPGNIRELHHIIERAVILAEDNFIRDNNFSFKRDIPFKKYEILNVDELEKQAIIRAIAKCKENLTKAADELGMGRSTLYRKMKKYDL
ncbi:MAG: sigma-54-dependent Fis family transcriptional regulator [Marinilabiliales bacterium]|nr:MAG: sigma-54-dependent Fis family transcriptional regulator [Marinilabiliales bacterium]